MNFFVKNRNSEQNHITMIIKLKTWLTHSHTMTPFDAPGKQAF